MDLTVDGRIVGDSDSALRDCVAAIRTFGRATDAATSDCRLLRLESTPTADCR